MDFLASPLDPSLSLGTAKAPTLSASGNAEAAERTAEDFEAFFLAQMFEHMFAGIEPDALFGGGEGEGIYRSMMFQEYGKAVAKQGGIGMSDLVQKEILKLQEVQQP